MTIILSPELKNIAKSSTLVSEIASDIKSVFSPEALQTIRGKPELIKAIMLACIESQKVKKEDKTEMLKKVYMEIYPDTSEQEMVNLVNIMEYIASFGDIVPPSFWRRLYRRIVKFFRRKA